MGYELALGMDAARLFSSVESLKGIIFFPLDYNGSLVLWQPFASWLIFHPGTVFAKLPL